MLPVGNAQLQTFGGCIDGDGGVARIKMTYSTINNGWRRKWKAVAGGGEGADGRMMTTTTATMLASPNTTRR